MQKSERGLLHPIGQIISLGVFVSFVIALFQSTWQANTSSVETEAILTCIPTPILNPSFVSTSATSSETSIVPLQLPSVTPLPISKTTDLAPNIPLEDKGQVIVLHCDGTIEMFLTYGTNVPLQSGDTILFTMPASSLTGKNPLILTPPVISTPTLPDLLIPTISLQTPLPYPAPDEPVNLPQSATPSSP